MQTQFIHTVTTALCSLILFCSANAQYATELRVEQDGSGEYTSIQAAIDATKSYPGTAITIHIGAGEYKEKVSIPEWNPNLTLRGADRESTKIVFDDHFTGISRGRNSTFFTATVTVRASNCTIENLTIENAAGPDKAQAIALAVFGDRVTVQNCTILGKQDTLFADGDHARQYYVEYHIEGTTDFIFGSASALFEFCGIHSKANSFITAASTREDQHFGFVFMNCTLTAAEGVTEVYLGRPWRPFAKTAFLDCYFDGHIRPDGWHNWSNPENERTASYAEFGNSGPGADTAARVDWSRRLDTEEAKQYTADKILKTIARPDWNLGE